MASYRLPPTDVYKRQALKEFRKEALLRKQQVKEKKLPATQFISWMIGQEAVIEGICKGDVYKRQEWLQYVVITKVPGQ